MGRPHFFSRQTVLAPHALLVALATIHLAALRRAAPSVSRTVSPRR
jgi:hypothetical protein